MRRRPVWPQWREDCEHTRTASAFTRQTKRLVPSAGLPMPVAAQLQRRPSNSHHNYRGNPSLTLDSANDERANETGRNDAVVTAHHGTNPAVLILSLIHISEPTRLLSISYA